MMKFITFILKLLFLVYTFKLLISSWKVSVAHTRSGGDPQSAPGFGRVILAFICAIPTMLIILYIDYAMGGTLLPK